MEELIQIINSFERLDLETELAIRKSFVEETFKKSELIIEEDKICDKIYFIKMGAVRRF
ncbi:Crp/Fnr family transcriptional regulator, partial [Flavobacterium nitrogenifigens]